MILEGIVTTVSTEGRVNVAPMGPHLPGDDAAFDHCLLKPFRTAQTYQNLKARPEAVLHVTDDVLLLAQAAVGTPQPFPSLRATRVIDGFALEDCCRLYELRITEWDDRGERANLRAQVVHVERVRDFFGFNRAKHAVVEAAILATRTAFLPLDEIERELARLAILVDKTGGDREHQAFAVLRDHVHQAKELRQREGAGT